MRINYTVVTLLTYYLSIDFKHIMWSAWPLHLHVQFVYRVGMFALKSGPNWRIYLEKREIGSIGSIGCAQ